MNGQNVGLNLILNQIRLLNCMLLLVHHKCSLFSIMLSSRASEKIKFRSFLVVRKTMTFCSNCECSFYYGSCISSLFTKSFKSQMNSSAVRER